MTVHELIEALSKEDPNRLVVMQSDAEGNGYSPLADFWTGSYQAETTWSGEAGLEKLTESQIKAGYTEEDILQGVAALVLCPVN
jgi:hypothetical protein